MRGDFLVSSANVTHNETLNVPFNANLNEIPTWRGLLSLWSFVFGINCLHHWLSLGWFVSLIICLRGNCLQSWLSSILAKNIINNPKRHSDKRKIQPKVYCQDLKHSPYLGRNY